MNMVKCPRCGYENSATATYCDNCAYLLTDHKGNRLNNNLNFNNNIKSNNFSSNNLKSSNESNKLNFNSNLGKKKNNKRYDN